MEIFMKKGKTATILIFCLMLSAGSLTTFLLPEREFSAMENRELQRKPKFSKKKFVKGRYQKQYESYLGDQFFCRDRWVRLAAGVQAALGRKDINGVYVGKDGYLLERSRGTDFDAAQVKENVDYLAAFLNEAAKRYGKKHVSCMMIPSKAQALPNRLPDFASYIGQDNVLDSIKRRLRYPELLFDATEEMQKHKQEYIYYRTDHHWTTLGACYAYSVWAAKTGQASPHKPDYYKRETVFTDFYGTTYNKAPVNVPADSVELFHSRGDNKVRVDMDDGAVTSDSLYFKETASKGFNRYEVFFSKNTFQVEVSTKAGTGKTLLLIKDSFANCFVPFLTEDYDRIIMLDYRYGKIPAGRILNIHKEITDVLVLFQTEKFMKNTKLEKLADIRTEGGGMEEFNPADFLE